MLKEFKVEINVKGNMGKNTSDANDASPALHRCLGRLAVTTQELDSAQLFNTLIYKTMGSGDKLTTREMYNNSLEFQFNALVIINCISRPRFKDDGKSMSRRRLLLLWPYSYVDNPNLTLPHEKKINRDLYKTFKN